jgi:hypothetical protein
MTETKSILSYRYVSICNLCSCSLGEYGITPRRDGPLMGEAEDAGNSFNTRANQKKRKTIQKRTNPICVQC